ncbi:COG1361 S-layer family protein [Methanolobus chelungpuianus]|uniref:S-layer domain protein n=1 Tax=Methanolobus chelungpuianus TaxID=502115 RepID=A0AAE3KXR5_9EURY|nr:COG1361 S-layer family protein [Methanolobus chelungpuianus]MCQ6962329.1 S-layer domain protein [Methanolobus chelungpuianus]
MSQSPSPARPGEVVELTLTVQNVGNKDLSNVVITVDPEYPFSQASGESLSKTISYMKARQSEDDATTVKFKLKVDADAAKKTYDLNIYVKDSSSDASVKTTVAVDVQGKEYAQIVTISKSSIDLATVEPLEFIITNTGTSPLKNMAVSWEDSTGTILPVYSDNTKYITYLGVGESVTVAYSVMANVNADPGLYQLDITLNFQDYDSNESTIKTKAGLFVGGGTDFDVTYSESSAGEVSLSLANVGNNQAYSVKVSIPEQENFRATGSTSTIVGNLEKGDYTITSFSVTSASMMSSGSSGERPGQAQASSSNTTQSQSSGSRNNLLVLIEYTDSTGQRLSVEKSVPIELSSTGTTAAGMGPGGRSQQSSTGTYLKYGLAAIVLAGMFLYYRKRKAGQSNEDIRGEISNRMRGLKRKMSKEGQ